MVVAGKKRFDRIARAAQAVVEGLEQRRMLSTTVEDGVWYVDAEGRGNHAITIELNPNNPARVRAVIDGVVAGSARLADIEYIEVIGGGGNDTININFADDEIFVAVYGGAGNDTITGGAGADELSGEEGDDSISGGAGDDYIYGDDGADTINGGLGDDFIYSQDGNDQVNGGGGNDEISAGAGDDELWGDEGDDELWGGGGDDQLAGEQGDDVIGGGRGDDELSGGEGDDDLEGKRGSDTMAGGLGDDELSGGLGGDEAHGGFDDDVIWGQGGRDSIWGGEGDDTLDGGQKRDTVYSEGNDQIRWDRWDTARNDELANPLGELEDEANVKSWLIDHAVERYRGMLGTESRRTWYEGFEDYIYRGWDYIHTNLIAIDIVMGESATLRTAGVQAMSFDGARAVATIDHSTTNTQEQGVDEADLVETDGAYLYRIVGNEVVIISALPAEASEVVSRTTYDGWVSGMYLSGDRLVVLSNVHTQDVSEAGEDEQWLRPVQVGNWTQQVKVTVLDVSDRASPTVMEETYLDGSLSSSRMVDGRLYLIMRNQLEMPRPLWKKVGEPQVIGKEMLYPPEDFTFYGCLAGNALVRYSIWGGCWYGRPTLPEGSEPREVNILEQKYSYETEDEYRARLEGMNLAELLPQYSAKVRGEDGVMVQTSGSLAGKIYTPQEEDQYRYTMSSVVLMNMEDEQAGPDATTNIIGMDGQTYASAENLYVTTSVFEMPVGTWQADHRTDIYKFSLGEDSVDLEATGEVYGWALNSFSMDEEGDYFRIATTSNGATRSNNLFVLSEDGDELKIEGGITNLANGERIMSARFMGDRAYVVTFLQIDPLFTIDLSDPREPRVVGELKIPGFSSYLHPVGDDHLLGVGRDGNLFQVSLFDVSDMEDPRRVDVHSTDAGGSIWSLMLSDHHAFSYFPEQGILAVPVSGWVNGQFRMKTLVLKVDVDLGFTELGVIDLGPGYGSTQRSVRIGEHLYVFGEKSLKVVKLTEPDEMVAEVSLAAPPVTQNQQEGTIGG